MGKKEEKWDGEGLTAKGKGRGVKGKGESVLFACLGEKETDPRNTEIPEAK